MGVFGVDYKSLILFRKFNMAHPIWRNKIVYGVIYFKTGTRGYRISGLRIHSWFSHFRYGVPKMFIERFTSKVVFCRFLNGTLRIVKWFKRTNKLVLLDLIETLYLYIC